MTVQSTSKLVQSVLVILSVAAGLCSNAGAQIINGDFERPQFVGGVGIFAQGDVPGWQTTDTTGNIEIWRSGTSGVPSHHASQHAELNAFEAASLLQTLGTTPGTAYNWSFCHRGRNGVDTLQLYIGGILQGTFSTDSDAWKRYSGSYVANGPSTVLEFRAIGGGSLGNFLDDVTFEKACCDQLHVTPGATAGARTFDIFNLKSPVSPICSVEISPDPAPPPGSWAGGDLSLNQGSGLVASPGLFQAPYLRIPGTGTIEAVPGGANIPSVRFNLTLNSLPHYEGALSLTVQHCDGSICILRYEPWVAGRPLVHPNPPKPPFTVNLADTVAELSNAMLLLRIGDTPPRTKYLRVDLEGDGAEIAGVRIPQSNGGIAVGSVRHTDRFALFEFATPLVGTDTIDNSKSGLGLILKSTQTGGGPPTLVLTTLDEANTETSTAPAEVTYSPTVSFLPQVADGEGIRTLVLVGNPGGTPIEGRIQFFDDAGQPWNLSLDDFGPTNSMDFQLPSNGVLRLQTDGSTLPAQAGYARITTERRVGAVSLFQFRGSGGGLITEAGVQQAAALAQSQVFAETGVGPCSESVGCTIDTGIAVANPNATTVHVSLLLVGSDGSAGPSANLELSPGEHVSRFVDQLFEEPVGEFVGSILLNSDLPVAATALRMQIRPTFALSALPVTPIR